MTVVVEDPLIAGMAITQTLPLHESSRRLRELYPECPRVYGVAVMGDSSRRRWWPLAQALTSDRLQTMFNVAAAETSSRAAATQQLVGHAGPCHHRACGAAGRAGGPGLGHRPGEPLGPCRLRGGNRLGVVDPTLRALPDDPFFADRTTVGGSNDARIVALPSEAALTTWIAHRSHRALEPLFDELSDVSGGAMSVASMWHIVGSAVVSAVRRCWMRWSGSGCRSAARLGWGQRRAC